MNTGNFWTGTGRGNGVVGTWGGGGEGGRAGSVEFPMGGGGGSLLHAAG